MSDSNTFERFRIDANWSRVGIGSKWNGNSNALVKDARYHYSKCLSQDEMDIIHSNII